MYVRVGALMVALLLGGCAGGPPKQGPESLDLKETPSRPGATSTASDGRDPFQGANRAMWAVNYDVLEPYVARPVVHGYARYIPQGMKDGIENLVENFNEPSSMVNHLITGDLKGAGTNLGRFTLNTTVGLLGIFDVAKHAGLARNKLELNTVLGRADIGDGAYLMVPVYGPTTTRKLVGDTIDTIYFPYALLTLPLRITHWALDGLGTRSKLIDQERIIDNALDPYALTKDFYLQYNQNKVTGRQTELKQEPQEKQDDSNLDDYLDEIDQ
ncbi:MlaA family lipoprotein [Aeromonas hydrophila]|uniref:MlaA family lipoprotein n=1 Tax=Aeromonas hydrophila TaxID=644 RepID=UPI00256F01E3|nr:VacJ family lipoprotein [Aeromonas hydrophila]MDL5384934.1 VacJ family lipoprotein [Aeromonas hydrophila]